MFFACLAGAPWLGMKNLFVGCGIDECFCNSTAHILRPDVSPLGFIHVKPVGSQISSERLLKFEGLEPVTLLGLGGGSNARYEKSVCRMRPK